MYMCNECSSKTTVLNFYALKHPRVTEKCTREPFQGYKENEF